MRQQQQSPEVASWKYSLSWPLKGANLTITQPDLCGVQCVVRTLLLLPLLAVLLYYNKIIVARFKRLFIRSMMLQNYLAVDYYLYR